MRQDCKQLAEAIRDRRCILFVGAGVSMSLGLPSWSVLIEHIRQELDVEERFTDDPTVTYLMLAEYYRLKHGSIGPLRSWMDRHWNVCRDKVEASVVHQIIVSLDFPIIYTTNFDRNLEIAFDVSGKEFVKVANARDISSNRTGVTQIVKFHGDFDEDRSLVLTETDYFDRLSFESPLDLKLKSDAFGRPILFIGYSMSDLNIRLLLHRIWETWERSGYRDDRPRSYVFMPHINPVQEALLNRWGISLLTQDEDTPHEALQQFLRDLQALVVEASSPASV